MHVRTLLLFAVLALLGSVAVAQSTGVTISSSTTPLAVEINAQVPTPLKPGSQGTIIATFRNALTPRQPITLQATATYQDPQGQTLTAQSNQVTLQVVQPVVVQSLNIALPEGWEWGQGVVMPYQINVTLNEGQSREYRLPFTVR